jgi:acyl carrier protein
MMTASEAITKVKRYWEKKGPAATAWAIAKNLVSPLVRRRQRLVFSAPLHVPREPSLWGHNENLLVIGPENMNDLTPELMASLEPGKHWEDFQGIRNGNRLFIVAYGTQCLYRSYACTVERPGLRTAVFFGDLEGLPEIRGAEISFRAVFPDLPETQISQASQASVAAWDSVATITLVNVIQEEFGIELDLDRLEDLDSFSSVHNELDRISRSHA